MDYRIISKPAFQIIGKGIRVSTGHNENMHAIPQFWTSTSVDGTVTRLLSLTRNGGVLPPAMLGVCTDYDAVAEAFTYMIAIENVDHALPNEEFDIVDVPAYDWAVFQAIGKLPESIQKTWQKIFADFLVNSEYKNANGPQLEVYPSGSVEDNDYTCEIWIPVIHK